MANQRDPSFEVLDEGDGLDRHGLVREGLIGVTGSTVTTPVEGRDSEVLRE
jgi:hypothetical protein